MALMHGKEANIYWDSQGTDTLVEHGQSWTFDATHDTAEITSMQDTWKKFAGGFVDWTATVECLLAKAGTDVPIVIGDPNGMGDVKARLELYCVWDTVTPSYKDYYGECICTGISPGADKDGIATVTYTFQGTGVIAWHSAAARPGA